METETKMLPTQFEIISSAILKPHDESDDYDMCETQTQVLMVQTENGEPLNEAAINDIYDRFRTFCTCAHDCCGHRFGGVTAVATMWAGRYLITVCTSRNY